MDNKRDVFMMSRKEIKRLQVIRKELRLGHINNLQDANRLLKAYLPIFNKKFEVLARGSSDFHRPVDKRLNLDDHQGTTHYSV